MSWLSQYISMDYGSLIGLGFLLLMFALVLFLITTVFYYLNKPKPFLIALITALIVTSLGVISIYDTFCIAGYVADDGTCAWE